MLANKDQIKERVIRIEKQYLNFPVRQGASRRLIRLVIDSKIIREFVLILQIFFYLIHKGL